MKNQKNKARSSSDMEANKGLSLNRKGRAAEIVMTMHRAEQARPHRFVDHEQCLRTEDMEYFSIAFSSS